MTDVRGTIADEARRIIDEYDRRSREIPERYYSLLEPAVLFTKHSRERALLHMMRRREVGPMENLRILDVGCGTGDWLADFESWGARRENLAGIELHPERGKKAAARFSGQRDQSGAVVAPGADIRIGDASSIPWPAAVFDVVVLSTVFSSLLLPAMQSSVAAECRRVLRPRGWIIWYDFFVDNLRNRSVKGVRARQIAALFPGFDLDIRRVTLAPPVARRVAPKAWWLAAILQSARLLNTHYLGLLRKP